MSDSTEIASKVANYLLEIKAVQLSPDKPFKWSSGWNSPIYCDNRVSLSFPSIRNDIAHAMARAIKKQFPDCDALCGVATAGIAIGAIVAQILELPYSYCRPKPKEHGMKNQLEGRIAEGSKVVVIEDLISTGGSSLKVVDFLRGQGTEVLGMGAIFTYGFDVADENMAKSKCPYFTLSNYDELLPAAMRQGIIRKEQLETLREWRKSPETWGS